MYLKQVDVRNIQSLQACIDSIEDSSAAQTTLLEVVLRLSQLRSILVDIDCRCLAKRGEALGKNDDFLAGNIVFLERFANDLF